MPESDGGKRRQVVQLLTRVHALALQGSLGLNEQAADEAVQGDSTTESTVRGLQQRLAEQTAALERRLTELGRRTKPGSAAQQGPPAGAPRASQSLQGDRDFLQRLSLAYLELHTASESVGDRETARLAERGYQETSLLLREKISRVTPRAAAADKAQARGRQPGVVE
jgi:hypothetical protein